MISVTETTLTNFVVTLAADAVPTFSKDYRLTIDIMLVTLLKKPFIKKEIKNSHISTYFRHMSLDSGLSKQMNRD